jgi:hypothetical protein
MPEIFPVNYAFHEGCVYFLTGPGSKLAAAADGSVMAFEVDHEDAFEHRGWSVVVVGPASIVPTSGAEVSSSPKIGRWVGGGPETLVRIEAGQVSGREIGRPVVKGWLPVSLRKKPRPPRKTQPKGLHPRPLRSVRD